MNKQDRLIEILIQRNIFKLPDGRDLYEGTTKELMQLLKGDEEEMEQVQNGVYEVTQLLAEAKPKTFLIPLDHGWIITFDEVKGKYVGEHEGIKLFVHFDKYLCMFCASEVSSGVCVARSFKEKYVIEKAKRRIAVNRSGFEQHMNYLLEECGVLNDEEGAKQ